MASVDVPRSKNTFLSKEKQGKTIANDGRIQVQDILSQCQGKDLDRIFEIDLHSSKLTKIENCQNFPKLRILDVSCNQIRCIRGLEKNLDLRELKLYSNVITKLEGLEKLKELCSLHLHDNKITKINNALQNLKKLKVLRLDSNQIHSITITELASCSKLTSLNISCNKIQDISFVNCLSSLEELYAAHNNIKKIPDLGRCKRLQELDLSHNQITSVSGLTTLAAVSVVRLEHNLVSDFAFSVTLKTVEELHLKNNKLQNLKILTLFPSLEVLDVSSNSLKNLEDACCSLQGCSTLRELSIVDNPCTTKEILYHQKLVRILPELEMLDGVLVKRPQSTPGKNRPPMRPVSVSQMLSTKQLEEQVSMATQEQESFESLISSKFDIVYDLLKKLPVKNDQEQSSPLVTACSSRPGTQESDLGLNSLRPGTQSSPRVDSPPEPSNQKSEESSQQAGASGSWTQLSPHPPSSSRPGTQDSDQSPRPASRCGNRARLHDAMAFAGQHFDK